MRRARRPQTHPLLDQLAGYAVRYYEDFVKPQKKFRPADEVEAQALCGAVGRARQGGARARRRRSCRPSSTTSAAPSRATRTNAKGATPEKPGVSNAWFDAIYEVLLGEERGPRFGSFIELYGIEETRALIDKALEGRADQGRVRMAPAQATSLCSGMRTALSSCALCIPGRSTAQVSRMSCRQLGFARADFIGAPDDRLRTHRA